MIADKIIPSIYVLELEGVAATSLIGGDFGIKSILIGSNDFKTDLLATSALQGALKSLTQAPFADSESKETIEFNPDFFPTLPKIELTEEQRRENEEDEELAASMEDEIQTAVVLTRNFDPLGDFVESRWTVQGDNFKILGKVVVNPDHYAVVKAHERFIDDDSLLPRPSSPTVH
jgi:hypothetical protein